MSGVGTTGLAFLGSMNQTGLNNYINQTQVSAKVQEDTDYFLPTQDNRLYLKKLIELISEEDSKKIITILVEYMSDDSRATKLTPDVETSILSFFVDRA
jgi:hypothetical protein